MKKILHVATLVGLMSLPLVYVPFTTDMYGIGKIWWWMMAGLLLLGAWVVALVVRNNKEEVKVNNLVVVVGVLFVWGLISWLKEGVGIREKVWLTPGGVAMMLGVVSWYLVLLQAKKEEGGIINWLWVSGIIVSVLSLITFLIPDSKLPIVLPASNPLLVVGKDWSVTGSIVGEVVLLGMLLVWTVKKVSEKLRSSEEGYIKEAVIAGVLALGLFLDIYKVTRVSWNLMDLRTSWAIATETFKLSPLWGVGLGNYAEAFTLLRPASYNMTPLWANSQGLATMGWLQIWTELGIVGLGVIAALGLIILRGKNRFEKWLSVALWLAWAVLPLSLMTWMALVIAMVMSDEAKSVKLRLVLGEAGYNVLPLMTAVLVVAGVGVSGFWGVKEILAENYMKLSMVAAAKNDGGAAYEWQRKAMGMLPNNAAYRRVYSQTNMAIAKVLLANKDISNEDKDKVSVLLQQAVREGKAAIALDGRDAGYWLNLAVIYRDMIGLVEGAADWSAEAYQQSMALEPTNVVTKLDFGGLLYAVGRFEDADRVFEQAVVNKADFANGWYNWAHTAKNMNKLYDAVQRLSQAVALVPATSGDYDKATEELNTWKKELDEAVAKAQAEATAAQAAAAKLTPTPTKPVTLTTPEALPTMGKEEKVNVPAEELEPPVVAVTVAPTATPQP